MLKTGENGGGNEQQKTVIQFSGIPYASLLDFLTSTPQEHHSAYRKPFYLLADIDNT